MIDIDKLTDLEILEIEDKLDNRPGNNNDCLSSGKAMAVGLKKRLFASEFGI